MSNLLRRGLGRTGKLLLAVAGIVCLVPMTAQAYDDTLDWECLIICPEKFRRAAYALEQFHEGDLGLMNGPKIGTYVITVEEIWNDAWIVPSIPNVGVPRPPPSTNPPWIVSEGGYSNSLLPFQDLVCHEPRSGYDVYWYKQEVSEKILTFIQDWSNNWFPGDQLQYIILLGDNVDVMPSYWVYTTAAIFSNWYPTDFFYSLDTYGPPGGAPNIMPAFSVGRIPVLDLDGEIDSGTLTVDLTVPPLLIADRPIDWVQDDTKEWWKSGAAHQLDNCVIVIPTTDTERNIYPITDIEDNLLGDGLYETIKVDLEDSVKYGDSPDPLLINPQTGSVLDNTAGTITTSSPIQLEWDAAEQVELNSGTYWLVLTWVGNNTADQARYLENYHQITSVVLIPQALPDIPSATYVITCGMATGAGGLFKTSDAGDGLMGAWNFEIRAGRTLEGNLIGAPYRILQSASAGSITGITWRDPSFRTGLTCQIQDPWVPGMWIGKILHITSGSGWGRTHTILDNDGASLEVEGYVYANADVIDTFEILDDNRDEAEKLCGDSFVRPVGFQGGKFENWWNYWTNSSHDSPGDDDVDWFRNVALCGGNMYGNWRYEGEMDCLEILAVDDVSSPENPQGDNRSYFAGMNVTKFFASNRGLAGKRSFERAEVASLFGGDGTGAPVEYGMVYLATLGSADGVDCQSGIILSGNAVLDYRSMDQKIPIALSLAEGNAWTSPATAISAGGGISSPFAPGGQSFGESLVMAQWHNLDLPVAGDPTQLGGAIAFMGFSGPVDTSFLFRTDDGKVSEGGVMRMREEYYDQFAQYLCHLVFKTYHQGSGLVANVFTRSLQAFIAEKGVNGVLDAGYNEVAVQSFNLVGDPCVYLPIQVPYDEKVESTVPDLTTATPGAVGGPRVEETDADGRIEVPSYNTYDLGVYEAPNNGAPVEIRITVTGGNTDEHEVKLIDPRYDVGDDLQIIPSGGTYSFFCDRVDSGVGDAINGPSVYIVSVSAREQAAGLPKQYMKESRIYVEVVNEFRPKRTPAKDILVVGDDQTDQCRLLFRYHTDDDDVEDYFSQTLDTLMEMYDLWHVDNDIGIDDSMGPPEGAWDWNGRHGEMTLKRLKEYLGPGKAVIWFTGADWLTTLTGDDSGPTLVGDQYALQEFLKLGGNLFMTGQDIGVDMMYNLWDLGYAYELRPSTTTFMGSYLRATYVQDDIVLYNIDGVYGDPVTHNIWNINIEGGSGANNQYYPSEIKPVSPAVTILTYDETGGAGNIPAGTAGIRAQTTAFRVIYFAFGFEGIDNMYHPLNGRSIIMAEILDWLGSGTGTLTVGIQTVPDPPLGNPPLTVSFDGTVTGGTGVYETYLWSFGDGGFATTEDATHTFGMPGLYTVTFTVTDSADESASAQVIVTVSGLVASIATDPSPPAGPAPLAVVFTGGVTGGSEPDPSHANYSYSWDFGDGESGAGRTVTHTYTGLNQQYMAALTLTDAGTAPPFNVSFASVAVDTAAMRVTASAEVNGSTVQFGAFVAGGDAPYAYLWDFGDGTSPNSPEASMKNATHTYTGGGTYTATLTVGDNLGISASDSVQVPIGGGGGGGGGGGCFISRYFTCPKKEIRK